MRKEIFIGCGLKKDEQKITARVVLKSGIAVNLLSGIENARASSSKFYRLLNHHCGV